MSACGRAFTSKSVACGGPGLLAAVILIFTATSVQAQTNANQVLTTRAVGGISISVDGVLTNAETDMLGSLRSFRERALQQIPADVSTPVAQRKISLKALDAALREQIADGRPLPDVMKYLAGLQHVQYVLVYPEQQDIVLVGPAEGWKIDAWGNVVGSRNGRPVLLLDDLAVALRSARQAAQGEISCSIDPSQEGLSRLQKLVAGLHTIGANPDATIAAIRDALGPQNISVTGVPATSHFARVLVAADYRMKRLAMALEPSPIKSLPSYMSLIQSAKRGMNNMLPRWWLTPQFAPLLRDADSLAWQLSGPKVRAMTEEDFVASDGSRQHTGKASPLAQKWADTMTARYDDLALADPIFAELRNCMELALVAGLMVKEDLPRKARCSFTALLDDGQLKAESYPAPQQVASQASVVHKGNNWIISASGGVRIDVQSAFAGSQAAGETGVLRAKVAPQSPKNWWWD